MKNPRGMAARVSVAWEDGDGSDRVHVVTAAVFTGVYASPSPADARLMRTALARLAVPTA